MHGTTPSCLFLVYANAGPGGDEALARWYMEVHGPDAFAGGSFHALHRYQALGDYPARFLAVWESDFGSLDEARATMAPPGGRRPDRSRITDDLLVVWSALKFRTGPGGGGRATGVRTLTLVEGGSVDMPSSAVSRYGDLEVHESNDEPATVMARWSGIGHEGPAPHGPYRSIFEHPETWPPVGEPAPGAWVSHWRPVASLRRDEARTRSLEAG